MMNPTLAPIYGALRIGRGATLHPARKDRYGVTALCGCPNTQNGFGINGGQFFAGQAPTCKRSHSNQEPSK